MRSVSVKYFTTLMNQANYCYPPIVDETWETLFIAAQSADFDESPVVYMATCFKPNFINNAWMTHRNEQISDTRLTQSSFLHSMPVDVFVKIFYTQLYDLVSESDIIAFVISGGRVGQLSEYVYEECCIKLTK